MVFVDVNFGASQEKTRIALFANSDPEKVARRFVRKHNLDE